LGTGNGLGRPAGALAVDSTGVYFVDGECAPYTPCVGRVLKVPIDDGGVTTLATLDGPLSSQGMTTDPLNVYLTNVGNTEVTGGSVLSVPIAGGAAKTLAAGQAAPWAIAVDSRRVYWSNAYLDAGAILSLPLEGGAPVTMTLALSAQALTLDSTSVYWTQWADGAPVLKMPLAGGRASTLAADQCDPAGIGV
jgi:hypothetical protein